MNIKLKSLLASMIIIFIARCGAASHTQSFVVSFQDSGGWSTKEWVEFDKAIPLLTEFTACHWERIRYFSSECLGILYFKQIPEKGYELYTVIL